MQPKRTREQRERDLVEIGRLCLKGYSQAEIAEVLNADPARGYTITQQTISRDVAEIRKRWEAEYKASRNALVAEQLRRLADIERQAHEEWERSKLNWSGKAQRVKGQASDGAGKVRPNEVEQTTKEEGRLGDPRYLDVLLKAIDRKAKLLGLDAPAKMDHTLAVADPLADYLAMPAERRREKIAELMSRLADRAVEGSDS